TGGGKPVCRFPLLRRHKHPQRATSFVVNPPAGIILTRRAMTAERQAYFETAAFILPQADVGLHAGGGGVGGKCAKSYQIRTGQRPGPSGGRKRDGAVGHPLLRWRGRCGDAAN